MGNKSTSDHDESIGVIKAKTTQVESEFEWMVEWSKGRQRQSLDLWIPEVRELVGRVNGVIRITKSKDDFREIRQRRTCGIGLFALAFVIIAISFILIFAIGMPGPVYGGIFAGCFSKFL